MTDYDDFDWDEENAAREKAQEEAAKSGAFTDGGGVTLTVDMDAFLRRLAGYGQAPHDAVFEVAGRVLAGQLRDALVDKVTEAAAEEIKTQVSRIVTEALEEPIEAVDTWGHKSTAKSLKQRIQEEAEKQTKVTYDRYSSGSSAAAKFIETEIGRQFKNELQQHLQAAKDAATTAVKKAASEVVSETIERARKGLI